MGELRSDTLTKYPDEFLGRCQTCLDNATLSSTPCPLGHGLNGAPVNEDECMIRRERKRYDQEKVKK